VTVIDCPQDAVGRLIGRGGQTARTLQQETGAHIHIESSGVVRKVTISGTPLSVERASEKVQQIIADTKNKVKTAFKIVHVSVFPPFHSDDMP